jgi:hypothetical protein
MDDMIADLNRQHEAETGVPNTAEPLSPKEVKWYNENCWDGKPRTR